MKVDMICSRRGRN